jgi:hypothetical protein
MTEKILAWFDFLGFLFYFCAQEFIEDLKSRIRQLNDLIVRQETGLADMNEPLVAIDDEQRRFNEAKLVYLKNEISKLNGSFWHGRSKSVRRGPLIFFLPIAEILMEVETEASTETDVEVQQGSLVTLTICNSVKSMADLRHTMVPDSEHPKDSDQPKDSNDDKQKSNADKKLYTRRMTIDELITTEKNYYNQMTALYQVFSDGNNVCPNVSRP